MALQEATAYMARIVVTGGAGFIGAHLTDRLISDGHEVIVIDNLSTGLRSNLNPLALFIEGNVAEKKVVSDIPAEGVSAVFHLAAQSSGEASFNNPYNDLQSNVAGTILMLQWSKANHIRNFVYTSSMAVYGKTSDFPLTENTPCLPTSFYGVAKLSSEHYIRLYAAQGLQTTIIRPFSVYGSRQNLENMKQGMASIYLAYILRGEPVTVKGSPDRFRDQTHVADVVDAMVGCLDNPAAISGTFNIATGRKTTVGELLSELLHATGQPANYPITYEAGTPGDVFGCYADINKANRLLGWTPRVSLSAGLAEMYNYFATEKCQ